MSSDKNFESDSDPVLDILKQLPEQWPKNQDTLELHIIASKKDASWISSRIFDYVSDDLLTTKIKAKHSEYSVELVINLSINFNVDVALTAGLSLPTLLLAIKSRAINGWLKHRRFWSKKSKKDNDDSYHLGDKPF